MTLKNVQDCLLLSYILEDFLDEEEFCALYDVNSTDYPVFEHGKYRRFDLNEVSEEECFSRLVVFCVNRKNCVRQSNSGLYRGRAVYSLATFGLFIPLSMHDKSVWDQEVFKGKSIFRGNSKDG